MLLVPYMRNFGVILERLPEEKRMQVLNEHYKKHIFAYNFPNLEIVSDFSCNWTVLS